MLWLEKIMSEPQAFPDSKIHGAKIGPIWGRQDPGGSHVGPINFVIWVVYAWLKLPSGYL